MSTLEQVIAETSKDGRVCPMPQGSADLWKLLPKAGGAEAPLPLILGAWWNTSDCDKRDRFDLHLRWANQHGALPMVTAFLDKLTSADWHRAS